MKKKETTPDILRLFKNFKADVLDKKQSHEQMVKDVYMMKFKIKPLQGDISKLNFSNTTFVETIWQLGKMDDFIEKHLHKIDKKQERAFFHYFEGMYKQLQNTLNTLHFGVQESNAFVKRDFVEMEIYKERKNKKLRN
jgi:NCAIR mutase (PurE)-related protein